MTAGAGVIKSLAIDPAPAQWGALLSRPGLDARAARLREQLGLPTDRPVIMTGHHVGIWHAGVLSKYLAAEAAARAFAGVPAWLVVDQDTADQVRVRYPVAVDRRTGGSALEVRSWEPIAGAGALAEADVPVSSMRAAAPSGLPSLGSARPATPSILPGLAQMRSALDRNSGAPGLAHQFTEGAADLLRPLLGPAPRVYGSALGATGMMAWLLDRMRRDPRACVEAYNGAARDVPEAHVAPLRSSDDAELPLWRLPAPGDAGPRRTVYLSELDTVPPQQLAPKALLMTALLRLGACGLFIHGLGGEMYDRITTRWIRTWLGLDLAPTVLVTATVVLEFDVEPITRAQIARARWLAHRARHDPRMLGDSEAVAAKQELLERIRAARRAHADPGPHFARMHQLLTQVRARHAGRLAEFESDAGAAAARGIEADIIADRTWAFPLHPAGVLRELRDRIAAEFGVAATSEST